MTFDVLIRNGEVVDGTGSPPRRADVGIDDERIVAVGELGEAEGYEEIDATGRLVTPGFIDVHAHSDVGLYLNPECKTQTGQGITTEVMGNCGYSPFPLMNNNRGLLLDPPGTEVPWTTAEEYFRLMGNRGAGINAVPQVGHLTLRQAVLDGEDAGFARVLVERGTDRVLGATIVAADAGNLISEVTVAMQARAGLSTIGAAIHPYPTQAEAWRRTANQLRRSRFSAGQKAFLARLFAWTR